MLNAGAAIYVAGRAGSIEAEGARRAEESIDSGRRAAVLAGCVRADARSEAVSARLDELVGATREAVERRKRERPLAELEREAGGGARASPSPRRSRGPEPR